MSRRCLSVFSLSCFVVTGLRVESVIHVELFFRSSFKNEMSGFVLKHHLLKRSSSPHPASQVILLQISWPCTSVHALIPGLCDLSLPTVSVPVLYQYRAVFIMMSLGEQSPCFWYNLIIWCINLFLCVLYLRSPRWAKVKDTFPYVFS